MSAARADPPPITTSNYSLDLFQGEVTTASRVIGLAGAYTALAEGCEGEYSNAASPSVRVPYSLGQWDYDVCLGFTNPGAFAGNDFENRGAEYRDEPTRFTNSVTINAGLSLQYGTVGVTVVYDQIRFGLDTAVTQATDSVVINRVTASVSNAFADDQLLIGVGFRSATFELDQQVNGNDESLLSSGGASLQVGAIIKPKRLPIRIGATLRTELDVTDIRGTSTGGADGMSQLVTQTNAQGQPVTTILPSRIIVPWEVEVGGAIELGRRPLNPRRLVTAYEEDEIRARYEKARIARAKKNTAAVDAAPEAARETVRRRTERAELEEEAREDKAIDQEIDALTEIQKKQARLWDRHEMLLLLGLLVTGNTPNAVGISDFLAQRQIPSGLNIVVSLASRSRPKPFAIGSSCAAGRTSSPRVTRMRFHASTSPRASTFAFSNSTRGESSAKIRGAFASRAISPRAISTTASRSENITDSLFFSRGDHVHLEIAPVGHREPCVHRELREIAFGQKQNVVDDFFARRDFAVAVVPRELDELEHIERSVRFLFSKERANPRLARSSAIGA